MLHQKRTACVQETLGQARQQIQATVSFPQQQPTAVGGDGAPVESGSHLARKMRCKLERRLGTLCHSKSRFLFGWNMFSQICLCQKKRLFASGWVRYPG